MLKSHRFLMALVLVFTCASLMAVTVSSQKKMTTAKMKMNASDVLQGWKGMPRDAATKLIAKYGQPDEATPSMLVWNNNGEWKRTVVYRDEIPHSFPAPHTDFLEQVIDYRVPTNKFSDLAEYDGSVIVERTKGEISARCDKEELNRLALNLANDVATGKRSVKDARKFYADTAMAFKMGKSAPYLEALQFRVMPGATADMDQPASPMTGRNMPMKKH
jgi:hypothetical protein